MVIFSGIPGIVTPPGIGTSKPWVCANPLFLSACQAVFLSGY